MTGSPDETVNRYLPFSSPILPARPLSDLSFSNSDAAISLAGLLERLKMRSVPGLALPASSMPDIYAAAEDAPLLMTLSLLA